jgi:RNA polymerase sigma factor (sigma-70 family)
MTQEQKCFIEKLYMEHFETLHRYAYIVLQDHQSAENLVNDTFLDGIKKVELLRGHENPVGWLMQALKLHMKHYLFTKAKQPPVVPLEDTRELSHEESQLKDAEAALSDEDRRFYELYYKVGLSHKELAKRYGISVSASQKRLERIREKLKRLLREP